MSYTIPNMKHDPTGVTIDTDSGDLKTSGTEYSSARVDADLVSTTVTRYESCGGWSSQSIHLRNGDRKPEAEIQDVGADGPYLVVNLGEHRNVFLPMSIAEAIHDALGIAEAVAS